MIVSIMYCITDLYSDTKLCQETVNRMQRIIETEGANRNCHIVLCSAINGTGLEPAFDWLTLELSTRLFSL